MSKTNMSVMDLQEVALENNESIMSNINTSICDYAENWVEAYFDTGFFSYQHIKNDFEQDFWTVSFDWYSVFGEQDWFNNLTEQEQELVYDYAVQYGYDILREHALEYMEQEYLADSLGTELADFQLDFDKTLDKIADNFGSFLGYTGYEQWVSAAVKSTKLVADLQEIYDNCYDCLTDIAGCEIGPDDGFKIDMPDWFTDMVDTDSGDWVESFGNQIMYWAKKIWEPDSNHYLAWDKPYCDCPKEYLYKEIAGEYDLAMYAYRCGLESYVPEQTLATA